MSVDVFALLADPVRRHMVELLHEGERSVGEIVDEVDIQQPGVSRHLRILHDAGFVSVRSEGQRRIYALRPERFQELDEWVRTYALDQVGRLERLAELVDETPKPRK